MLYEAYEKKIRKRYKRFNTIYRFRILLSAITLFMVLLTTSFFVTKGMVFSLDFDNEINYGEEIKLSSTSFLSNQEYYYKTKEATTWDNNEPTIPGDYEVKIVTKGVFSKREKVLPLTIKEKDVSLLINKDEVEFGDHPFEIEDFEKELVFGDYIDYFEYDYKDPSKTKTEISLSSIIINNKNHEDVTRFYNINSNKKEVEFVQRKIEIELESNSFIYDGNNKTSNEFKITSGSLVSGHYIELTSKADIFNVSRVKNDIDEIIIYDEEGLDVTVNYLITSVDENSYLEITERDLDLELADAEKSYDSTPLVSDELVTPSELELLDGHTVKVTSKDSITNYGITLNNIDTVIILDEEGNDVTNNYNVNKIAGELKINKHIIQIKINSDSKIYDGFSFENIGFDILSGELFNDGEYFELLNNVKETNVGIYENIVMYRVKDANGNISENYLIDHSYGELEITSRDFTLEINSDEKIYDGKYLNNLGFDVEGLADTHEISITNEKSFDKYFEVGEYSNEFDYIIIDKDGNDVSSNYTIETIYGLLKITKRELSIQTNTKSNTYDGYILEDTSINILNETSLSSTDLIEVTDYPRILNVQKVTNEVLFIINHSEFLTDATSNYDITYDYGFLEITLRAITIKNGDYHKVYDGNELVADLLHHEVTLGTLANNEEITFFETTGAITNVVEEVTEIKEGSVVIENTSGLDVSSNYEITLETGLLSIEKRSITIKPEDIKRQYNGLELTSNRGILDKEHSLYDFVLGDTLEMETEGSIRNVGTENNIIISYDIFNEEGLNVTDNYDVEIQIGLLIILKREITIETGFYTAVYDGLEHFNKNHKVIGENDLVLEDKTQVTSKTTITNVDDLDNVLTVEIYTEHNELNSSNYNITYVYNSISITKREITIKPEDVNKTYDGLELISEKYEYTGDSKDSPLKQLVEDEEMTLDILGSLINAGTEISNIEESSIVITKANGEDSTNNYNVIVKPGEIRIDKREITIETGFYSAVYDGLEHSNEEHEIISDYKLVLADYTIVVWKTTRTNAGKETNILVIDIYTIDNELNSSNYEIIYEYSDLIILERSIAIRPDNVEKQYDGLELRSNKGILDKLYSLYELVLGDVLEIETEGSIRNFGSTFNVITSYDIYNKDGINVTDNYDVKILTGILKILKREITIETGFYSAVYDGKEHFNENHEVISDNKLVPYDYTVVTSNTTITNVGKKENILTIDIYTSSGNLNNLNYNITYVYNNISITKREITIKPEDVNKTYDGLELISEEYEYTGDSKDSPLKQLVKGEEMTLDILGSLINAGTAESVIDESSIVITKANGEDSTNNYNVIVKPGEIKIDNREITVKPEDVNKTYDGLELVSKEYEYTGDSKDNLLKRLVEGEEMTLDILGSLINAGTEISNIDESSIVITKANGEDSTNNYNVIVKPGEIRIDKREISYETDSTLDFIYNGEYQFNNGYTIYGELAANQESYVIGNDHYQIDANKDGKPYSNNFKIGILANGEDVTFNYDIKDPIYGEIIINRYQTTFISYSECFIYDGNEHYELGYDIDLIKGDNLSIIDFTRIINVEGLVSNKIEFYLYNNVRDLDVTSNYEISYDYGDIQVYERLLRIKPLDLEKQYDGEALTNTTNNFEYVNSNIKLVDGHLISFNTSGSQTDIGNSISEIIEESIKITSDGNDVTKNYAFDLVEGTLTVLPREIHIKPKDESKIYDGEYLFSEVGILVDLDELNGVLTNSLLNGHKINIMTNKIKNVKSVDSIIEFVEIIDEFGNDVTHLYEIFDQYTGNLTINRKDITLTSGSKAITYDSNEHFHDKFSYNEFDLINGDEIEIVYITKEIFAGTYQNILDYTITSPDGFNENYNIIRIFGEIKINKAKITIESGSETFTYTGKGISHKEFEILNGELQGNDYFNLEETYYPAYTNVEKYDNDIVYRISHENGQDSTTSYDIEKIVGKIIITKSDLIIQVDYSKPFDGNSIFNFEVFDYFDNTEIIKKITMIIDVHNINIGTYHEGTIKSINLTNAVGSSVDLNNFNIICDYREGLKITQQRIEINLLEAKKDYDGKPLMSNDFTYSGFLVDGHTISVQTEGTITNPGEVENIITNVTIFDSRGSDVTDQYIINKINSVLIVIGDYTITLGTVDYEAYYDGEVHTNNNIVIIEGFLYPGHTLYGETSGIGLNVGEYKNKIIRDTVIIRDEDGNDITDTYQIFIGEASNIIINKVVIEIETETAVHEYNGETFSNPSYIILNQEIFNLVSGYRIGIDGNLFSARFVRRDNDNKVISYDNISNYVVFDNEDQIDNHNYEVKILNKGKITIMPRTIYTKTGSKVFFYDYKQEFYYFDQLTTDYDRLVNNEELTYEYKSFTSVDKHRNEYEYVITRREDNGDLIDVTSNYTIIEDYGIIEIKPADLKLELDSTSLIKIYDANNYFINVKVLNYQDLYIYLKVFIQNEDVGYYYEITDFEIEINYEGNDITENFNIYFEPGYEIIIKKLKYEHILKEKTFVYNDIEYKSDDHIQNGHLIFDKNHMYVFETSGRIRNVGLVNNKYISFKIFEGEKDVTHNYDLGETLTFTTTIRVTPRDFYIELKSKDYVYDGLTKNLNIDNLTDFNNSDFIEQIEVDLVEGQYPVIETLVNKTDAGKYLNYIVDVIIRNQNGDDVTSNYNTNYLNTEDVYLTIALREFYLELTSKTYLYDGVTEFSNDEYIVYPGFTLADNQVLIFKTLAKSIDAGIFNDQFIELRIIDKLLGNKDVTYNYVEDIDQTSNATLEVLKRNLHIQLEDESKVYNGEILRSDKYSIINDDCNDNHEDGSDCLVNNHDILIETNGEILNVGEVDNVITKLEIYDGSIEVTKNYEINLGNKAVLEITKRPILIKSDDKYNEKIYDGEYLTNNNYLIEDNPEIIRDYFHEYDEDFYGLLEKDFKHKLNILTDGKLIDVNIDGIDNRLTSFSITDFDNNEVSDNYDLIYIEEKLIIYPRELLVEIEDVTKDYDGLPLESNDFKIIMDDETRPNDNLLYGDILTIMTDGSITDPGTVNNNLVTYQILGYRGDVSDNYNLRVISGRLTITREIEIQVIRKTVSYDGSEKSLSINDIYFLNNEQKLPDGYNMDINIQLISKDGTRYDKVANAGIYKTETTLIIYDEKGRDVSNNYLILINENDFTINKRAMTIQAESLSREYNGTELTYDKYNISFGSLLTGHSILNVNFNHNSRITTKGSVDNVISSIEIYDEYYNDQTLNYNITYRKGRLTITARTIIAKIIDITKVFDGTELTSNAFELILGTLASSEDSQDVMSIITNGIITDPGTLINGHEEYNIVNNYGNDVTSSYSVTIIPGTLTITGQYMLNNINSYLYLEERNLYKI